MNRTYFALSKRARNLIVAPIFLGLFFYSTARTQTSVAELLGVVKDTSGAVMPGATITVTSQSNGQSRHLVSDNAGNYAFTSLPIGIYTIKAERPNFKTRVVEGVSLQVGRQERIDLLMEVGEVSEQVTVQETVPLLRTTNAEVSEVIANQRMVELPLNGRQFVNLVLLSDNIVPAPRGTRGTALAQTGPAVMVAGQRAGHNMYFLDGVSITDQYFNHLVASPPIDTIQEFNIQKSIYSAEFGGKASATVSAATKSGTNSLHGSLWEFLRNDLFDARNYFDPRGVPPFRQNQFGGAVGGPVKKDKTFFFTGFEGQRVRQSITQTFSLPSAKVRSGDFSGLATIYDPLSGNSATGQRLAFTGNRIPSNRLNPVALEFLKKIPLPTRAGEVQNFSASPKLTSDHNQFTVRADHRISTTDSFFGRFYFANYETFQPFGSSNLNETLVPGFGYQVTTYTRNLGLDETHIFSPTLINEVRFGYLRNTGGQTSQNKGIDFAGQSGLQGVTRDPAKTGFPAVNFSGLYSTMGDPSQLVSRRNNSFDYFDNVSWIRGAHNVKFGVYYFRLRFNPSDSPNARGAFTYTPRFSSSASGAADGNSFADFLMGYPSSAVSGIGPGTEQGRTLWQHYYAQDDWRVNQKLTANIGVRYEINGQISETNNQLSNIEVNRFVIASDGEGHINSAASALLPLIPVPYTTSKDAGYARTLQLPNFHRVAPRLGLAWQASDKTVVRAGYGLYFNQAAYGIQVALAQNLPFYFNKSVTTANTTLIPTLTMQNILLASSTGTISGSSLDYNYRSEYAESWNLSVQHKLTENWAVQLTYFGSKVVGADNSTFRNVPLPGPGPVDPRRPNPNLSGFKAIRWDGYSSYQSTTAKLEKRFSSGVTFDANYTWSKSIDDASDVGGTFSETNVPQDVRNIGAEKALSSFDHRHRLVFSYSYELPFGPGHGMASKGFSSFVAGGWSVRGIGTFQSGAPFTVNLPNDNANIGAGPSQRPNLLREPNLDSGQTPQRWFDTTAFSAPAPFTFGNAGRNVVRTAGQGNVDLSLIKGTSIGEKIKTEFRAEIFNLFNHTNFADAPGRIAFTPNFGRYFTADNSRQMQLALKLSF